MPAVPSSYIDVARRRQSARGLVVLAVAAMAASLGGCAGLGLPFADVDRGTTASIRKSGGPALANASFVERVDPGDWQSIRTAVAGAPAAATDGIVWANPATGTTGTVAVAVAVKKDGLSCRTFSTTINDMRGVRRYRGDACSTRDGLALRNVAADDLTIS